MLGLLLGPLELLCLFGWISGTSLRYSSLSELCLPGKSASCQMQGKSVGLWSMIIFFTRKTGLGTSRRRRVKQGLDMSRRCRLQGPGYDALARHVTSLPPTRARVQCPRCGYPSTSFTFADSIRCSSSVGEFFFPSPIHRIRHAHTFDTTPTGGWGLRA